MASGPPAGRRKKMQQSEFEDKQDFKMTAAYESEPKGLRQCQLKGHSAGRTSLGNSRLADLPKRKQIKSRRTKAMCQNCSNCN